MSGAKDCYLVNFWRLTAKGVVGPSAAVCEFRGSRDSRDRLPGRELNRNPVIDRGIRRLPLVIGTSRDSRYVDIRLNDRTRPRRLLIERSDTCLMHMTVAR